MVCGPTNKSVVVIARKLLACTTRDDTINIVLIGDKSELLADSGHDLLDIYAATYMSTLRRQFQSLGEHLLADGNIAAYEKMTNAIVAKMDKRIPSVSLLGLQSSLEKVVEEFGNLKWMQSEEYLSTIGSDQLEEELSNVGSEINEPPNKALKEALTNVDYELKRLDDQTVVQSLLESADVVFCTLSSAGCKFESSQPESPSNPYCSDKSLQHHTQLCL